MSEGLCDRQKLEDKIILTILSDRNLVKLVVYPVFHQTGPVQVRNHVHLTLLISFNALD